MVSPPSRGQGCSSIGSKLVFMKLVFIPSFAFLLLFFAVACDRHPVSQTIPGYQEKSHLLNGKEALTPAAHPMKFFYQKNSEKKNDVN